MKRLEHAECPPHQPGKRLASLGGAGGFACVWHRRGILQALLDLAVRFIAPGALDSAEGLSRFALRYKNAAGREFLARIGEKFVTRRLLGTWRGPSGLPSRDSFRICPASRARRPGFNRRADRRRLRAQSPLIACCKIVDGRGILSIIIVSTLCRNHRTCCKEHWIY